MKQSSSEAQTQTFQIQEKDITITVEEKGKNTTFIKFNRDTGLTLELKDEESGVTQQTIYDKTSISHISEGKSGKSTIVQTPDSISIVCKDFILECDTALTDAKKTVTQKAQNKIFLDAPIVNSLEKNNMGG